MSAAEYRKRSLDGSLIPAAPAPKGARAPSQVQALAPATTSSTSLAEDSPKALKKRNAQPEFDQQCALFEWGREPAIRKKYPELRLMSSSLNGVKLTRAQAGKAKAAGMLEGESDVRLPVSRGRWVGLIIEMKHGRNKATDEQLSYGADMEAEGHQFHICYSWEAAMEIIISYLAEPRRQLVERSI